MSESKWPAQRVARDVLSNYPIDVRRLRRIHDELSVVYQVQSTRGEFYSLRLSGTIACHGLDEARGEVAWIQAIARDTDLIVPEPLAARDGTFVRAIDGDPSWRFSHAVLFRWMPGRTPGDRLGGAAAREVGRILCQLHHYAESYDLPGGARVRRFDSAFPYADTSYDLHEPVYVFRSSCRDLFPDPVFAAVSKAHERVVAFTQELFASGRPRLIHNDVHPWNLLYTNDGLAVRDFEDTMWGFPVQDLATTIYYLRCRADGPRLEAELRSGYESCGTWPFGSDAALDTLVAGRGLILLNTVLAARHPEVRAQIGKYIGLIGNRIVTWMKRVA